MPPGKRPFWLRGDRLLVEQGIAKVGAAGRRYFATVREGRRAAERGQEHKAVRRGWCLGDETSRMELLDQIQERHGPNHYGEERFEPGEAKALRIVEEEMKRRGWGG